MPEEPEPIEDQAAESEAAEASHPVETPDRQIIQPAYAAGFVIVAFLLGMLIVMLMRGGFTAHSPASSPEIKELRSEAQTLRDQINRDRMASGLPPLEGSAESLETIATRIKKDTDTMVGLASSYQSMLDKKDADFQRSELARKGLTSENAHLREELQRALANASGGDLLRSQVDALKASNDQLNSDLAKARLELQAKARTVSQDDYDDLKRRLEETRHAKDFFESKVNQLQGEQSKYHLFATSENELLPQAVELFRGLRKLGNLSDSDLQAAYADLGSQVGANVITRIGFATGSSELSPKDQDTVRNLASNLPDGDLLLAIGYASETGDVDQNRKLSSDRATAVAELYSSVKRPGQRVQAVFLGPTDRFGKQNPESNQVVEIWHIRKK